MSHTSLIIVFSCQFTNRETIISTIVL